MDKDSQYCYTEIYLIRTYIFPDIFYSTISFILRNIRKKYIKISFISTLPEKKC